MSFNPPPPIFPPTQPRPPVAGPAGCFWPRCEGGWGREGEGVGEGYAIKSHDWHSKWFIKYAGLDSVIAMSLLVRHLPQYTVRGIRGRTRGYRMLSTENVSKFWNFLWLKTWTTAAFCPWKAMSHSRLLRTVVPSALWSVYSSTHSQRITLKNGQHAS